MSITDELRKYADRLSDEAARKSEHGFSPVAMELERIADRIDAEHERGMADAELSAAPTEAQLSELGYVKLPVDADGECIHAGDVLDGYGKTIEVVELRHGRSGWLLISRDGNGYDDTFAFTHHHKPTVEDVLREFAYGLGVPVADSYIAASAAKLRLAGDAE